MARNAVGEYITENTEESKSRMSTSRGWIRKSTKLLKKELKLLNMLRYIKAGQLISINMLKIISRIFNYYWMNHFDKLIESAYPCNYWKCIICPPTR